MTTFAVQSNDRSLDIRTNDVANVHIGGLPGNYVFNSISVDSYFKQSGIRLCHLTIVSSYFGWVIYKSRNHGRILSWFGYFHFGWQVEVTNVGPINSSFI